MSRTIYLHIGPHKTGTTYIQKNLYLNKEYLKNLGYLYPEPKEIIEEFSVYCHKELYKKPININNLLKQNNNATNNIIVSFEGLSLYSKDEIFELKKHIDSYYDYNIKIIFYLRNPAERVYSLWQEKIKHGECISITKFIIDLISKPFSTEYLNYDLIISKWTEVFHLDNIILIDYHSCEDIFISFLKCININKFSEFQVHKGLINRSLPIEIAELIRVLNSIAKNKGILQKENIRNIYLKKRKEDPNILNLEKIFCTNIQKYISFIEIGDFFLKYLQKNIIQKYSNNFLGNYKIWSSTKVKIIDDQWLINEDMFMLIKRIYKILSEYIKN